jgi:hypothetical protein
MSDVVPLSWIGYRESPRRLDEKECSSDPLECSDRRSKVDLEGSGRKRRGVSKRRTSGADDVIEALNDRIEL